MPDVKDLPAKPTEEHRKSKPGPPWDLATVRMALLLANLLTDRWE